MGDPDPRFNKQSKGCFYITYHGSMQQVIKCHENKGRKKIFYLLLKVQLLYVCFQEKVKHKGHF
jgi:hypothetical protein